MKTPCTSVFLKAFSFIYKCNYDTILLLYVYLSKEETCMQTLTDIFSFFTIIVFSNVEKCFDNLDVMHDFPYLSLSFHLSNEIIL